jgi:hypothetical protein
MEENVSVKAEIGLDEKYGLRSLTRGELKALRKEKISLAKIDRLDPDAAEEVVDRIVATVMGDAADDLPNPDALKIFVRIIELTYGDEKSEKNSSGPGVSSAPGKTRKK